MFSLKVNPSPGNFTQLLVAIVVKFGKSAVKHQVLAVDLPLQRRTYAVLSFPAETYWTHRMHWSWRIRECVGSVSHTLMGIDTVYLPLAPEL